MQNENGVVKTHNWGVKWTTEEDQRLIHGIELFGENDWKKVSEVVGTRAPVKCIQRWEKVLRPDLVKGKWTDEEDELLKDIVFKGFEHWGKVSDQMPGRTSKQCRERWANYLDPSLLKTPFTQAEDDAVIRLQSEFGNKWAYISRLIPGRTENSVKLRYHALVKQCGGNTAALMARKNSSDTSGGSTGGKVDEDGGNSLDDKALQAIKKQRLMHQHADELLMKQVMLDPGLNLLVHNNSSNGTASGGGSMSSAEQQMLLHHRKQQQQHFHHLQQLQHHHHHQQQQQHQHMLQQPMQFQHHLHHQIQLQQQILMQQQLLAHKQGGQPMHVQSSSGATSLPGQHSHLAAQHGLPASAGNHQQSVATSSHPTNPPVSLHGPTLVPHMVLPVPPPALPAHTTHLHPLPLTQQHTQASYLMSDIDNFIKQQTSKRSQSDSDSSESDKGH